MTEVVRVVSPIQHCFRIARYVKFGNVDGKKVCKIAPTALITAVQRWERF